MKNVFDTRQFLKSRKWRELRGKVMKLYPNVCAKCGFIPSEVNSIGAVINGLNVDHIKPRNLYPELAYDLNNLQILCSRCNEQKGNAVADYRKNVENLDDATLEEISERIKKTQKSQRLVKLERKIKRSIKFLERNGYKVTKK